MGEAQANRDDNSACATDVCKATALDLTPLRLAALATIVMSITAGVIAWYWRYQIGDECSRQILSLVALAGALIFLPLLIQTSGLPASVAAPATLVIPLGVVALIVLAGHFATASVVAYGVLLAIWCFGIRAVFANAMPLRRCLFALCFGLVLGNLYFFIINQIGTSTIFAPEAAIVGEANLDSIYHSAIASIVSRFGVASSGLDGFVPLSYHVFSHFFLGHVALWLDTPAINIYAVVMLVVGGPLLLFATALAVFSLWRPVVTVHAPVNLLLVPVALFSVFEILDWYSYLASESYLFAMVLFLLSFPTLLILSESESGFAVSGSLVTALLVTPIIAFTKISVGAVFLGAVATAVSLRILSRRQFWSAVFVVFVAAVGFLIWLAASSGGRGNSFFAFAKFLAEYPTVSALNIGVVGAGILFLMRTCENGANRTRTILALASLMSLYPALVLNIRGGAEYYFVNIGAWIAILSLSAFVILPTIAKTRSTFPSLVAILTVIVATVASPKKVNGVEKLRRHTESIFNAVRPEDDKVAIKSVSDVVDGVRHFEADWHRTYASQLLEALRRGIGNDRVGVAIYISPQVFSMATSQVECRARGFLFPAYLGVPMLLGLPTHCSNLEDYGFSAYGEDSRNRDATDEELCRSGHNIRLSRVLRSDPGSLMREVLCPANAEERR